MVSECTNMFHNPNRCVALKMKVFVYSEREKDIYIYHAVIA